MIGGDTLFTLVCILVESHPPYDRCPICLNPRPWSIQIYSHVEPLLQQPAIANNKLLENWAPAGDQLVVVSADGQQMT